ncbi:MAG TPA: hypothetical protein VFO89_14550, partial [Thermoanaerobaculia bacterium]|nr:hypothetical protein [Thermoanaerobaculia bacterium]
MPSLTIGDVLASVDPRLARSRLCPAWPPDAFALAAALLQRSGAYSRAVTDWPPRKSWTRSIERIGSQWRKAAGERRKAPAEVQNWWGAVRKAAGTCVESISDDARLSAALIQVVAAADVASAGIGLPVDRFADDFEARWLPLLGRNTFCEQIDPSRAVVLPKLHSPRNGITIRSMTHHLALYLTGEVTPQWLWAVEEKEDWSVRLLIIPWPKVVKPADFRPTAGDLRNMPTDFGFFTF